MSRPEDFFKENAGVFSPPLKTVREILRLKKETGDGIAVEEKTAHVARDGGLHSTTIKEHVVPSCGHVDAPAIICGHSDSETPQHSACQRCSVRCYAPGCGRMLCRQHADEVDGQFLCAECSRKVRLDGILKGCLGWLGI